MRRAAAAALLSAAARPAAAAAAGDDPCTAQTGCAGCLGQSGCGWCSTKIIFQDGSRGSNCAGPSHESPFSCEGIYSTITCQAGYTCGAGGCALAAPGAGIPLDKCNDTCSSPPPPPAPVPPAPAPVVTCGAGAQCLPASPGVPGAMSKEACEASCGKPTSAPQPPAPAAKVYKCDAASATCGEVPGGTAGASALDLCKAACGHSPQPPPPASPGYDCDTSAFQCVERPGAPRGLADCQQVCRPEPTDPCEPQNTCTTCLAAGPQCGWCSSNVTYSDGKAGGQCAGVGDSIPTFFCDGQYSTDSCVPPPHDNCSKAIEIMFLIDGSCSIGNDHENSKPWHQTVDAVRHIAGNLTFGTVDGAEMAIVQFGQKPGGGKPTPAGRPPRTGVYQHFTGSEQEFMHTVDTMPQSCYVVPGEKAKGTATGVALKMGFQEFEASAASGHKALYRAAIILTDGSPAHDPEDPEKWSGKMMAQGIDIYGIGIGKDVSKGKIQKISSKPSSKFVFMVNNQGGLDSIIQTLVSKLCQH